MISVCTGQGDVLLTGVVDGLIARWRNEHDGCHSEIHRQTDGETEERRVRENRKRSLLDGWSYSDSEPWEGRGWLNRLDRVRDRAGYGEWARPIFSYLA